MLNFDAYFKQTVHESPNEYYRVRYVKVYYYLEDDSISVVEPPKENRYRNKIRIISNKYLCLSICFPFSIPSISGIPQGKLIKRHQIPCNDLGDSWHWKKLNLGIDMAFYGKIFHIYNCDEWTSVRYPTTLIIIVILSILYTHSLCGANSFCKFGHLVAYLKAYMYRCMYTLTVNPPELIITYYM